jgi:hypothetical protein
MDLELRLREPSDRDAVLEAARDPYVAEVERIGDPDEWIARKQVVRRALTEDDDVRVQATVEPWNLASQRVLERAGLRREVLLRSFVVYGDRGEDACLYAAARGDV